MLLSGDEGKGPGVFLWDLRDEWALIQRGGDWRICNEMGPRPGNPSQNLDSGFLEEKKQVKMGKPKILAGLSWAGEGGSCSTPGIMTILPYDSSFILRLLLELMLFIPLHTWETKAWSVYITHLLRAWITTRSGWREALEHESPSLGFLLLGWGNLAIPAPLCVLEPGHAILDLSHPQAMLGPQTGRGLGQPSESLSPYTALSFQVLNSLSRHW